MATKIEAKDVKEKLSSGTKTVNVLSAEDYHKKRIPGTLNVSVEGPDFDKEIREAIPDKDAEVIVHCSGPTCEASPKAGKRMEALGYTNVFEYRGGLEAWEQAGFRLEGADAHERPPRPQPDAQRERSQQERQAPAQQEQAPPM